MRCPTLVVAFPVALALHADTLGPQQSRHPFMENKGQVGDQHHRPRPDVLFSGSDGKLTFHLTSNGVSYQLHRVDSWAPLPLDRCNTKGPSNLPTSSILGDQRKVPQQMTTQRVDIEWLGANAHARVERTGGSEDYDNFYNANAPDGVTDVRSYESVRYKDVYPGIDLNWHCAAGKVKYDFEVSAGADPDRIRLRIEGADDLVVNGNGELEMHTPLGMIIEDRPVILQDGKHIQGAWTMDGNVVRFRMPGVNPHRAFTIDPGLRTWGTYYGEQTSFGLDCDADAQGNVLLLGTAEPSTTIATIGAFMSVSIFPQDAYVAKFDHTGERLWATWYGGEGTDQPAKVSANTAGDVFFSGITTSSAVIATPGTFMSSYTPPQGLYVGFLAKLNAAGVRTWGTYDYSGGACSSAADGGVYYGGGTSQDPNYLPFIPTAGVHQTFYGGGASDHFVQKFNADGSLAWGSFVGGPGDEYELDIAASGDDVILFGGTTSTSAIATAGTQQQFHAGGSDYDPYIMKLSSAGQRLWGTYFGSECTDLAYSVAVDDEGGIYVGGFLYDCYTPIPVNVLTTEGTFQENNHPNGGLANAFIAKFSDAGLLQWGTFLGSDSLSIALQDLAVARVQGEQRLAAIAGSAVLTIDSNSVAEVSGVFTTPCSHEPVHLGWDPTPEDDGAYISCLMIGFDASTGQRRWGSFLGSRSTTLAVACTMDSVGRASVCGTVRNDTVFFSTHPDAYSTGEELATADGYQPAVVGDPSLAPIVLNAFLVQFVEIGGATNMINACGLDLDTEMPATAYQWIDCTTEQPITGATSPTFTAPGEGSYAVILDNGTCGMDTSACVLVVNAAPVSIDVQAISGCGGLGSVVTHVTSGGPGPFTYTWDPAVSAAATADDLQNGLYTVTVFDAATCTNATATVQLNNALGEVFVPTAFSPDASGRNDLHCVYGPCIATMSFGIYDRWGTEVFASDDQSRCWDGTFNGKALDPEVFVYRLNGTLIGGEPFQQSGNITLIR